VDLHGAHAIGISRTEQARDRRIAAVRRWIVEAVGRAK
jgi:hypothetical protein